MTEGEIGVLPVSYLFLTCMAVYVGVGVCIRTHTTTAHVGYSGVRPWAGMRHLEELENPGGLSLGLYVFVYGYKMHIRMYMLGVLVSNVRNHKEGEGAETNPCSDPR